MGFTKEQFENAQKRRESLERIHSIIVGAAKTLYIKVGQNMPGSKDSWKYYMHPMLREKLHEALLEEYRSTGNMGQFHRIACKPVLEEFLGVKIVDGYEYGIVLAHDSCIYYPDDQLTFKELFITHDKPTTAVLEGFDNSEEPTP